MIDLQTKRLSLGAQNRIPGIIWGVLYFVTIIGTSVMGCHTGLSGARRSLAVLALLLAFSVVMTLIVDLDHPQTGLLRVSQQAMIELRDSFEREMP